VPARRKFSTSTVAADGRLVPWLAASGPLSYTPEDPPASDYYFQYGWILPEILTPTERKRRLPDVNYFSPSGRCNCRRPVFKRLGYILERCGLFETYRGVLARVVLTTGYPKLDTVGPAKGKVSERWKLRVNVELDPERWMY